MGNEQCPFHIAHCTGVRYGDKNPSGEGRKRKEGILCTRRQ